MRNKQLSKFGKFVIESGISVDLFAKRLGISRTSMYNYMSGKQIPNVKIAIKICRNLGKNVVDFWG